MAETKKKFRSSMKFSWQQILVLAFASLVFLFLEFSLFKNLKNLELDKEIDAALGYGESISTHLELTLNQSLNTTQTIKNLWLEFDNEFLDTFDRMAKRLYENDELISCFYVAPGGINKVCYPHDYVFRLGFNMLENYEQDPLISLARGNEKITIEGPLSLVEGGTGLIITNPVYEDNKFKGFVVAVLDWEKFEKMLDSQLSHENTGYHFSLWKENSDRIVTDERGYIYSDCDTEVSKLVNIKVAMPNDTWYLSIEPENGWAGFNGFFEEFVIGSLLLFVLLALIWYKQLESFHKTFVLEHDALTGVYTRSSFYRHAKKLLKLDYQNSYDLLMVDICGFKVLNSIYGVAKCDDLLCYIADCIREEFPDGVIGRYGGDQFVVLFNNEDNKGRIYLESRTNAIVEDAPIPSVVLKYGFFGDVKKESAINLTCDRALMACRSILHNYDVMVAKYDGPISRKHLKEQMIEASFENALKNKDFQVWYQPKFDAKTEKLCGAEALTRWINEDGTIVSPADFIYVFEEDGLIVRLDEYVFRTVCETIKEWMDSGLKVFPISVNVSRTSLHHKGLVRKYKTIVERVGIPIEYVPLEITESLAYGSNQIKEFTKELKRAGFRIDMDDFGTGSSSLASLNILPFDVIKIDKSLVDFIGTPDGNELVRHTIELAHFKHINVVAEGVETKEQLEFLRGLGCDAIQGYYFSPPMSKEKSIEYLKKLNSEGKV